MMGIIEILLILLAGKGVGWISGAALGSIILWQLIASVGGLGILSVLGWEGFKLLVKNIQAIRNEATKAELRVLQQSVKDGKLLPDELPGEPAQTRTLLICA